MKEEHPEAPDESFRKIPILNGKFRLLFQIFAGKISARSEDLAET